MKYHKCSVCDATEVVDYYDVLCQECKDEMDAEEIDFMAKFDAYDKIG